MAGRPKGSAAVDRAAIREMLKAEGLEATLAKYSGAWLRREVYATARVLGITDRYRHTDWNPAWTPRLGTVPDAVLAAELGISRSTVSLARVTAGIPACRHFGRTKRNRERAAAIPDRDYQSLSLKSLYLKYGSIPYDCLAEERKRRGLTYVEQLGRGNRHVVTSGDLRRVAIKAIRAEYPGVTLKEIGEALGITRERVRQLELRQLVEEN